MAIAALGLVGVLWMGPSPGTAQTQERWSKILGPDGEALPPQLGKGGSRFALFGSADYGIYKMSMPGFWCWENQHGETDWICPLADPDPDNNTAYLAFRNTSWNYGVPPSQWEKAKALVPELANATGGGWSVFSGYTEEFLTDQVPMDGLLGPFSAGTTSRDDGSCADIDPIDPGTPLIPSNTCPETWGSLGYLGGQIVSVEAYDSAFQADGPSFAFDFWRMPEAYAEGTLDPVRALGFHQVYGWLSDWSAEKRAQYGGVLPGGDGDPARQGWPLGLVIREDAFAVPIPPLGRVLFVQTLIINRSADLYDGLAIDYDSLYVGLSSSTWWESGIQNASFYFEPWSGMVKSASSGQVTSPPCNGANPASDIECYDARGNDPAFEGDQNGGGYVILKSPIGDLRNKLFTRRPDGTPCSEGEDLFCDPDHPLAGDTITFNIAAPCGYRSCTATTWRAVAEPDWMRRMFGLISGITSHAIGARTATTISDRDWWHLTRSYTHPIRVDDPNDLLRRDQGFNTHIPGVDPETRQLNDGGGLAPVWDWNHDLIPDTLFYSSCNPYGCSVTWSDTLRGPPGAGPYVNAYGNVGTVVQVGPISLAADDTTSWVMAYYIGEDQDEVDRFAANAVDHYMAFYLAPGPPAVTSIKAVDVQPGDPTERTVTLYLGDESETWVDPFLAKQAADLATDPISVANPWLPDTLAYLSEHNLQALHIFRSCDDGNSFDADGDCEGDPATGGIFEDLGWLPYETFDIDALGEIPNVFVDDDVPTGRDILYSVVAETRGAEPLVIAASGRAEALAIAPKLLNALSTATGDPNVANVYVPASLQAGASRASVNLTDQSGPAPIAPDGFHALSLDPAGDDVEEAAYGVRFGATAEAVDSIFGADPAVPDRVSSYLVLTDDIAGTADTLTTTRLAGVTTAGGSTSEAAMPDGVVRTTTFSGLTAALLYGAADEPLLASDQLEGDVATPGAFITRADWPRLLLSVADRPGELNAQFFVQPTGDTIADQARPGVIWGVGSAVAGGLGVFGDMAFGWEGGAYGPNAPFTLDFMSPEETEQDVATSLAARPVAQQTLAASAEVLALAQAALTTRGEAARAAALTEDDIVQADLPFAIENESFGRAVDAIMLKRPTDTRVMGRDADTLRIAVPGDVWLPGDTLILVETVEGSDEVTWARAVLGCFEIAQFVRLSCNPVTGRGGSLYLSPRAGQTHHVQYFNAFTAESEYRFEAVAAVAGDAIPTADIRAALERARVVPNPYILSADTDRGDQSMILFTNLPPRGRLRIYSLAGQFVQEITWEPEDLADPVAGAQTGAQGDLRFDLTTREGNQMASGLYIFHLTAFDENDASIGEKLGKFVIIR